jgi:hypothetical protein
MAYPNDEWQRKGATLSDKTAGQEFGLTQDEIYDTIDAGEVSAEATRASKASRGERSGPGPGPADRRSAVTPRARHAASLPYELRDAREPPFCCRSS